MYKLEEKFQNMSNNPRWDAFQPPIMDTDPAILDYKSMEIPTKIIVSGTEQLATNSYRNGTNYGEIHGYIDSSSDSKDYGGSYSSVGSVPSARNGTRFANRAMSGGMENNSTYLEESNVTTNNSSSYQDQSNNQGPREAGIIEKLLVS